MSETFGDEALSVLHRSALLLIKPDGLVAGKASPILHLLERDGFSIVAAEPVVLSRLHWRELWRYQLTSATLDRLAINDLVLPGEHLLLLLRDSRPSKVPATVRLSGLKGPSDVSRQQPESWRRILAQPNRVLSFFHVADEPADLVRELALFLEADALRRACAALQGEAVPDDQRRRLAQIAAETGRAPRVLDGVMALARADDALRNVDADVRLKDATAAVGEGLNSMRRGEKIEWRVFARHLVAAGIVLDKWDLATLGASYIIYDEPGYPKQIEAVPQERWADEA